MSGGCTVQAMLYQWVGGQPMSGGCTVQAKLYQWVGGQPMSGGCTVHEKQESTVAGYVLNCNSNVLFKFPNCFEYMLINHLDCRPDGHTLPPTTREFCRHTLS